MKLPSIILRRYEPDSHWTEPLDVNDTTSLMRVFDRCGFDVEVIIHGTRYRVFSKTYDMDSGITIIRLVPSSAIDV